VHPFNRGGHDYYFLTVSADMAALVFVTLFYQLTVNADPEALVETYHQAGLALSFFHFSPSLLASFVISHRHTHTHTLSRVILQSKHQLMTASIFRVTNLE
jgi:hypothetical protein